jgi:hypothetical protein
MKKIFTLLTAYDLSIYKTINSTYPFLFNKFLITSSSSRLQRKMTTKQSIMRTSITLFTLFILTTLSSFVHAQNKVGKVTGVAKAADGQVLDAATIGLLRAKDKSLVKSAISNKAGEFEIEKIADGQYIISVTAVGFSKYAGKPFDISETNSNVDLKVLELQPANKTVGAVTVTTTRPLIENKIDKMIVNVEAAVTNIGATALDVIEKSPGISVDRDGNISLKGKQGVIILIDGKPSYLSGQDLANLLRNMSADQLDQLEIMSQPSAKFDASGNSGVLNIKTKRNNLKGFNGTASATYTQGFYPKSNASLNINSRKGKINLFANYNYSYFKVFEDIEFTRKFRNQRTKEVTSTFDQSSYIVPTGQPQNFKAGIDLFATEKTTLGIVVGGNYNLRKTSINGQTDIIGATGRLDSINKAENTNRDPWYNYSANFNLRHLIDKKGREITSDVDYLKYVSRNRQNSDNYTFSPAGTLLGTPYLLRGYFPSDIDIYSAKVDYVHPLKNNAKFEAGVKSSYVTTDNDAQFTYWNATNSKWAIDAKSNHFIYKENINAAYVNTSKQMKKWGVQLGLRLENTNAKGNQITDNNTFNRHYTQLFPTAYVSYAANKTNNFGLSYGRRIDRPNYQDLNPFKLFLDQYTYMQGNPFLTPQFSHNIELSHNYKGQLNSSVNYTRTTDIIAQVLVQNDTSRIIFRTRRNVATRRNIGASISYNKPLTKYWTISAFTNIYNNYFEGIINEAPLSVQFTAFNMNVNNQFRFKKGWSGEISGFFRSRGLDGGGTLVTEPMGTFSFGGSKQILKTKGTLRLSIRDPFYIQRFRGYTKFDNIDFTINQRGDTRQVSLAFNYRFGKNQNNIPQRKRTSASQDEQNRVGGSN